MNDDAENKVYFLDPDDLPTLFPTHAHSPEFWEHLGRTIATFGFLEEVLGKAIFSFTATRPYSDEEVLEAYEEWLPKLERALTDQLWNLVESYGKAVKEHPESIIEDVEALVGMLKEATVYRNVLCHGSWRKPDEEGKSIPLFVNKKKEVFQTAIDVEFLKQVQSHVAELACEVINSVTQMGWQFPGANGLGKQMW
ncbi:hypothetical protein RYZ26_19010 [Terasakiella sp. A23]|uniref:hypothetical protein n=1 Tax=Terasakiella sp. FCG-A23 TaxID=3080561 RepID=UPI002952D502|nr:hypothetical protein [Terasakiella sp. A23]MDV7341699.1 hypothetical protein [Terasakiella sp. A23]